MTVLSTPRTYGLDGVLPEAPEATGFTLADLERLKKELADFDRLRWSQPRQIPRVQGLSRPRVRFWAQDFEGNGLRLIEGTLDISKVDMAQRGDVVEYTLTGHMFPPINQYLVPDEIEEPHPVATIEDGLVSTEIGQEGGFEPIGTIDPDSLKIETKADFDVVCGRTVKTREETTVEFSSCTLNPDVLAKFFLP